MKNKLYKLRTGVAIILMLFSIASCTKEVENINDLNTTLIVRHKKADMPAYIHGNASEKVFLIILHGGPGGTGLQYRVNAIKSKIEKKSAVVYFDQRGSGNSQGSYSEADLTVDLMAEDVLALVKVIKAKYGADSRFFLMGHSWGGTLGPATLLKNQDAFLGWIDVDGSHDPGGSYELYQDVLKQMADEQIAQNNSVKHWQDVIDVVNKIGETYSKDDFFKLNRAAHDSEDILAEDNVINTYKFDGSQTSESNPLKILWNGNKVASILERKGLFRDLSYKDQLHKITIPSLVLWGKHDLIVPAVGAQEAYDLLGSDDKELFMFDKSAHSPMFSEPDLFAEKVIQFMDKHK